MPNECHGLCLALKDEEEVSPLCRRELPHGQLARAQWLHGSLPEKPEDTDHSGLPESLRLPEVSDMGKLIEFSLGQFSASTVKAYSSDLSHSHSWKQCSGGACITRKQTRLYKGMRQCDQIFEADLETQLYDMVMVQGRFYAMPSTSCLSEYI